MSEYTAHIDNHINESKVSANKFTAVKRKRNVSYFVGNIDSKTTEKDIYQYFKVYNVHLTFVRLYRGLYGSSVKINVPEDLEPIMEDDYFWPENKTYRK